MKMARLLLPFVLLALSSIAPADDGGRHYLFIGTPSPEGWRWLVENPEAGDREKVARAAVERVGGELLGYYWGVNNAKNYIIVRLPADAETVPAFLIMRLSTGLLTNYEAIEIMPSARLPVVLKRIAEISAADDIQSGEIEE